MNPFQRLINFVKNKLYRRPLIEAPKNNTGRLGGLPVERKNKEVRIMEDFKPQTAAKKYRKEVAESSKKFNWKEMARDEAITTMLKQLGMKSELANNEDAKKEILAIVNQTIGYETEISDSTQYLLKGLIGDDGTIQYEENFNLRNWPIKDGHHYTNKNNRSTIIDLNTDGQLFKTTIEHLDTRDELYDDSTYLDSSTTTIESTIDNGIEIEKNITISDTTRQPSKSIVDESSKTINLKRDPKLLCSASGKITVHGNFSRDYDQVYIYNVDAYGETLDCANLINLTNDDIRANKALPGFGYCGTDTEKLKQQELQYQDAQNDLIRTNSKFRKLAEKLGLVEPRKDIQKGA